MTPATQAAPKEHFAQIFGQLCNGQVPQEEVKFKAERLFSLVDTGKGCPDTELNDFEKRAEFIHDFTMAYLNYTCRPKDKRSVSELTQSAFLQRLTPQRTQLDEITERYIKTVVMPSLTGLPGVDAEEGSDAALWLENFFYYTLSEESLRKQVDLFNLLNAAEYSLFNQQRASLAKSLLPLFQQGHIPKEDIQFFISFLKTSVKKSIEEPDTPSTLIKELQENLNGMALSTFIMYLSLVWYGTTPEKRDAIRDNLTFTLTRFLITYS